VKIPYNLTEEMLFEFIGQNIGLIPQEFGGGIHIIMDRTTVSIHQIVYP